MPEMKLHGEMPVSAGDYDLVLHSRPDGAARALFVASGRVVAAEFGRCSLVRVFSEECLPRPVLDAVEWAGEAKDGYLLYTSWRPGADGPVRSLSCEYSVLLYAETVSEAPPELSARQFPAVPVPEPVEVGGIAVTFASSCRRAVRLFDDADAALAELARAAVARNLEPGAFEAFEADAGGRRVGCWAARERDGSALRVGGIVPV